MKSSHLRSSQLGDQQENSVLPKQEFGGFDFLRVIFSVTIVAYKTRIFYIPEILVPSSFATGISEYVLSGMVGALAVPVFLQISLFLFHLKTKESSFRYLLQKRLPRLISLYLFWVVSITVFDILFVDKLESVESVFTSLKNFLLFVVSGNSTPYFFFFSLIFVTVIAELLSLILRKVETTSARRRVSYGFLIASLILVFTFSTIEPMIAFTGIQAPFLKSLNNLTGWDYSPFNFLPYVFTAAITTQEYNLGKLEKVTRSLKQKLYGLLGLTLAFFALEWVFTAKGLLIQVDQAPLDHYMRLSLVFGSWLLLYLSLLIKPKPSGLIKFLSSCSLGIYGFHVFFIYKRPLPLQDLPILGSLFQTFPLLQIVTAFWITLVSSIALTVICKRTKILKRFV